MTLVAFQTALADLVASPALCLAVRANSAAALAAYDLGEREHRRLAAVVWQRGMSANCTVYRATRVTPLYTLLPMTFAALGTAMTAELDDYWAATSRMDVHFDIEIGRFGTHLKQRLEQGRVEIPHDPLAVIDLLTIELARETLRLASANTAGKESLVTTSYEPAALMAAALRDPVSFEDVPRGEYDLIVRRTGNDVAVFATAND
jgi:hypothetical protein